MSRGISFSERPEQSTVVRSQWHTAGHSIGSARQSAAYLLRKSSVPGVGEIIEINFNGFRDLKI
jgi:hypothetical protein